MNSRPKKTFEIDELSNNLNERVKELECLYSISRISETYKNDVSKCLEKILAEIPKGLQFPDLAEVELNIGKYCFGKKSNPELSLTTEIRLSNGQCGSLSVDYVEKKNIDKKVSFLIEEEALLRQIAHEITRILEFEINEQNAAELQKKLRFNDRLSILSEITSGIAHELNTPLNNVLGYSEILLKSEKDTKKRNDLNRVIRSAVHAREIVKKLMFFSCDLPTNYEEHDVNEVIKDSLDLLKIQLNEKNIKLVVGLYEKMPLIKLDVFQFTQVVFNIVRNSIQAMNKGGILEVNSALKNNEIIISFRDNGCGMSDNELQTVFKPFVTGAKEKTNMGIGLSVTSEIIKAHNGKLKVQSKLNEGSIFTIILPLIK